MFRPRRVVVPVDEISRAEMDVVEYVVGDEVDIKSEPPAARNMNRGSVVVPDDRASCDPVEEAIVTTDVVAIVVVPIPTLPAMRDVADVVANKLPTVS